jgi:hypothetical protein
MYMFYVLLDFGVYTPWRDFARARTECTGSEALARAKMITLPTYPKNRRTFRTP